MKEIFVRETLLDDGKLKRFLRIRSGSYPWRTMVYICIEHCEFSPRYYYAETDGKSRVRPPRCEWQTLFSLQMNHSSMSREDRDLFLDIIYDDAFTGSFSSSQLDTLSDIADRYTKHIKDEDSFKRLALSEDGPYYFSSLGIDVIQRAQNNAGKFPQNK